MWPGKLAVAAATAICALGAQALPRMAPDMIGQLDQDERNIWFEADKIDGVLKESGRTQNDLALTAYMQEIVDKLYPEWRGRIHVHLVDDPVYNAFAMPNGSIYMHSGLLARMESEAQLATILGHEGGHFLCRHGYQLKTSQNSGAVLTMLVTVVNPFAGLFGSFAAVSGIYGYSRDNEREADQIGFSRMVQAGYDPQEAVKIFNLLAEEARAAKEKPGSYLFVTHPRLEERIESYRLLLAAQTNPGGMVGAERFEAATRQLRQRQLVIDLQAGRYSQLIDALSQTSNRARYGNEADFYLGEAYRLRRQDGDVAAATLAYSRLLANQPEHAGAMRGMGMLAYRDKRWRDAQQLLQRYLALDGNNPEAGFVRQILDKIAPQINTAASAISRPAEPINPAQANPLQTNQ